MPTYHGGPFGNGTYDGQNKALYHEATDYGLRSYATRHLPPNKVPPNLTRNAFNSQYSDYMRLN